MMLVSMTMADLVADLVVGLLASDGASPLEAVVINCLCNVLFCQRVTGHAAFFRCVTQDLNEVCKTPTSISGLCIGMRLPERQQHAANKQFRVGLAS